MTKTSTQEVCFPNSYASILFWKCIQPFFSSRDLIKIRKMMSSEHHSQTFNQCRDVSSMDQYCCSCVWVKQITGEFNLQRNTAINYLDSNHQHLIGKLQFNLNEEDTSGILVQGVQSKTPFLDQNQNKHADFCLIQCQFPFKWKLFLIYAGMS